MRTLPKIGAAGSVATDAVKVRIGLGHDASVADLLSRANARVPSIHPAGHRANRMLPLRLSRASGRSSAGGEATAPTPIVIPLMLTEHEDVLDFTILFGETTTSAVDRFMHNNRLGWYFT